MLDVAAFTCMLFQHRKKGNQDVGAQTRWAEPNESVEPSSGRGWAPCDHLICCSPNPYLSH